MDLNFADLKKEAAATAEDFVTGTLEAAKQATQQASHDLLGGSGSGSGAAPLQDDNAHTEDFFSNDQKLAGDFDFEHVDPQTFVQRMSAGAKEAQEQLDAKFAQKADDFSDFLGNTAQTFGDFGAKIQQQTSPQAMSDLTRDFMNAERGIFGDGPASELPKAEPAPAPAKPTHSAVEEDDLLGGIGNGDGQVQPPAPLSPMETGSSHFYDNLEEDEIVTSSMPKASNADVVSTKDSDTDSPSVSYNPSPAKKNPIADALKEQDSDKFISSEDLLGDLKEERTATPEFHVASSTASTAASKPEAPSAPPAQAIPTTDLDADDDEFMHDIMSQPAVPAKFEHSQFEEVKDFKPTPAPAPAPASTPAPAAAPAAAAPKPAAVSEPVKAAAAPVKDATVAKDTSKGQPNIVSVEEIFYKYGLDAWFKPERLHPRVESLIYWRDVKKSGIVFGAGLVTLLAISCFSVISVFAYLSLLALTGTVAFRIYKTVMQAIQKTNEGHPFKEYLEFDLTLSQEKIQNIAGVAVAHINGFTAELRRLFLVEDLIDSIKFGVILWVMTYIGAWFNGMTLVILAFVSLFTLPKVYENNKQSIDTYLDLVRSKLTEVTDKIKVAIPIGNKKPIETDKDK